MTLLWVGRQAEMAGLVYRAREALATPGAWFGEVIYPDGRRRGCTVATEEEARAWCTAQAALPADAAEAAPPEPPPPR